LPVLSQKLVVLVGGSCETSLSSTEQFVAGVSGARAASIGGQQEDGFTADDLNLSLSIAQSKN